MLRFSEFFRSSTRPLLALLAVALLVAPANSADEASPAETQAGKVEVAPEVAKLSVFPAGLTLSGKRDSRRLIVSGTSAAGLAFSVNFRGS